MDKPTVSRKVVSELPLFQRKLYEDLVNYGPATAEELAKRCKEYRNTKPSVATQYMRIRLGAMEEAGAVLREVSEEATGGRRPYVWSAVPMAPEPPAFGAPVSLPDAVEADAKPDLLEGLAPHTRRVFDWLSLHGYNGAAEEDITQAFTEVSSAAMIGAFKMLGERGLVKAYEAINPDTDKAARYWHIADSVLEADSPKSESEPERIPE